MGRATCGAGGIGLLLALAGCDGARGVDRLWADLRAGDTDQVFSADMVADLPDPARRFLLWSMAEGSRVPRSVEVEMHGLLWLEPDGQPLRMTARQVLAPPAGFIWKARAVRGPMRITGHDLYAAGAGEMKWRLFGLIPVMTATGEDVTRSAAGRLALEAVLLPGALLPGAEGDWEPVDDDRARFRYTVDDETVVATLTVAADGRPVRVSALRWRGDLPEGAGYSRFDVEMEGVLQADGYRLPARIQAGWEVDEPGGFRFFDATLDAASF